jgi:hypothetical protein
VLYADTSASFCEDTVSAMRLLECQLTISDFISTPFPAGLNDDEELDVIVMDFALDDFRAY